MKLILPLHTLSRELLQLSRYIHVLGGDECKHLHVRLHRRRSTIVKNEQRWANAGLTNVSTFTFRSSLPSSSSFFSRVLAYIRKYAATTHLSLSLSPSILVDFLRFIPLHSPPPASPPLATPRARQPSSFLRLDHLEALNLFAENIKRRQIS